MNNIAKVQTELKPTAVKYPFGYVGYLTMWQGETKLKSVSCQTLRATKKEAKQDAVSMGFDLLFKHTNIDSD